MDKAHKIGVARTVLAACADQGYGVVGSLAFHLHQVEGAREPQDIDLFTNQVVDGNAVRAQVTAALQAAGYEVEQLNAWNRHPSGEGEQNRQLRVSHPEHGSVVIDMIRAPRYFPMTQRQGIPTLNLRDVLFRKLVSLEDGLSARVFIDLAALQERLGHRAQQALHQYVDGVATHVERVSAAQLAAKLAAPLARGPEIPDADFAAYGVSSTQAARIRQAVHAMGADLVAPWAKPQEKPQPEQDRLNKEAQQQMARADGELGRHTAGTAPSAQQAAPANEDPRLTQQMASATDQQLQRWRREATRSLEQAEALATTTTDTMYGPGLHEFTARLNRTQLQYIDAELDRRAAGTAPIPQQAAPASGGHASATAAEGPQEGHVVTVGRDGAPSVGGASSPGRAAEVPPAMAEWLSRYHEVVLGRLVPEPGTAPDRAEAQRLMAEADAVIASAFPDPNSGTRVAHASTQQLLGVLVSQPLTSPESLPLSLLPDELLASRANASPEQAAQVAAERERRATLAPAGQQAQEALRGRLADRLRETSPARSRPSAAVGRSRSTTPRRGPGRDGPASSTSAEQAPHLRRRSGPDRGRGHGRGA